MSSGFTDKLFWRSIPRLSPDTAHCFKKSDGHGWVSLCGRWVTKRIGGQACSRPRPELRCGLCDGLEMERRGWDESGPDTLRTRGLALPRHNTAAIRTLAP